MTKMKILNKIISVNVIEPYIYLFKIFIIHTNIKYSSHRKFKKFFMKIFGAHKESKKSSNIFLIQFNFKRLPTKNIQLKAYCLN